MRSSILIIYTGGTIGMKTDAVTGALVPFDFSAIYDEFHLTETPQRDIDVHTVSPVIDSSNVGTGPLDRPGRTHRDNYARYDGFVVLHGTDTMSYTASALSFHAPKTSANRWFSPGARSRSACCAPTGARTSSRPSKSPERTSTAGPWFPKCRSISKTGSSAPTAPPSAAPRP